MNDHPDDRVDDEKPPEKPVERKMTPEEMAEFEKNIIHGEKRDPDVPLVPLPNPD